MSDKTIELAFRRIQSFFAFKTQTVCLQNFSFPFLIRSAFEQTSFYVFSSRGTQFSTFSAPAIRSKIFHTVFITSMRRCFALIVFHVFISITIFTTIMPLAPPCSSFSIKIILRSALHFSIFKHVHKKQICKSFSYEII